MSEQEIVRTPLRVHDRRSRTLDQRLSVRFPWLAAASFRLMSRLPPRSRVRQALLRRVVALGVQAYNRRDLDAVVTGYDPAIEYHPYRQFAESGLSESVYHGHSGYRAYIEATYEVWGTEVRLEPREVVDLGDRIVLIADMPMRAQASGVALDQVYAGVSTLRNGRVVRQDDFLDPAEALGFVGLPG